MPANAKVYILVPTYNEKENLPFLVEAVEQLKLDYDWWIVVIDDSSPDGTGKLAQDFARSGRRIKPLIRPKKEGLGSAYRAGFAKALQENADYIITMDADFSHDPRYIPVMLSQAEDHDLVLGSRYVKEGVVLYPVYRKALSFMANLFAQLMLGFPFHDVTSGFNCYRRETLVRIMESKIFSEGYTFQVETHYHAHKQGARILEIPIVFRDRRFGKAKMSVREIVFGAWHIAQIRLNAKKSISPRVK